MISYLIHSTICMGLVLLFYHAALAREKIYQINRWYLLGGLLFSLVAPFIPVGISDSLLTLDRGTEIPHVLSGSGSDLHSSANSAGEDTVGQTSDPVWIYPFLFCLYGIVTLILAFRMIRHLYRMQLKTMKNPATFFKGHRVVLMDEEVVPHTFWKTIFLNKKQYENKEIGEEVLIHELTHARQNHSLDILIVEMLKTICWFNPFLYFYKIAIQINHEYIADDKVLSSRTDVASYQALLLHMSTAKSMHYLSASLNFNVTKKRFKMMTLNRSVYRSFLKTALIIPFIVVLGITFGCGPASVESGNQIKDISLEIVNAETIKLNDKTFPASQFKTALSELSVDPKRTVIDFKIYKDVPMGLVTDIEKVIREYGAIRINYSTEQSNNSRSEEAWRTELDSRNILDIYINEKGNITVNQDRASLSSLSRLVREFIINNGHSPELSESPRDAIIAIRTDTRAPYESYSRMIGKVIEVYDELRDQAAVQLFNQPFQSLEEGSKERDKIRNMYPKKISVQEPLQ